MIKEINKFTKSKVSKNFKLDDWSDLKNFDFDKEIPTNDSSVEITCKKVLESKSDDGRKNKIILLNVDYVSYLKSEKLDGD